MKATLLLIIDFIQSIYCSIHYFPKEYKESRGFYHPRLNLYYCNSSNVSLNVDISSSVLATPLITAYLGISTKYAAMPIERELRDLNH